MEKLKEVIIISDITALILTYNEEDNIEGCLESIKWVDEIIIVDSYSSDTTLEKAKKYTNKIFKREFDDFANQRNFGLDKISTEWVMSIDADERVSKKLKNEILTKISSNRNEAYKIPRKNYFLGKWIKYCGWYPDYCLRLYKNKFKYSGKVHESINLNGKIKNLKNPLIHYTYKNLSHYVKKINHYTRLAADEMYKSGKKVSLLYVVIRPIFQFVKMAIFQKGVLLGGPGILLSILQSYYKFLKYAKLWELNNVNN